MASRSSSHSRVERSTSVNNSVTVPDGRPLIDTPPAGTESPRPPPDRQSSRSLPDATRTRKTRAQAQQARPSFAGAEAAEHAGVLKADGSGGDFDGGAVADQVLASFQPQQLLVTQWCDAGCIGEPAGKRALADAAGAGDLRKRQRVGEPILDVILGAVRGVAE